MTKFASYGDASFLNDIKQSCHTNIKTSLNNPYTITSNYFAKILPYKSIDTDLIFLNNKSKGFGMHIIPSSYPDNQLVSSILELIKHHLPIDVDCSVMLHKHPYISKELHRGLQPMLSKEGIFSQVAKRTITSHLNPSLSEAFVLKDYRCYVFISTDLKLDDKDILVECRKNLERLLNKAQMTYARLNASDFLVIMQSLLSLNVESIEWPSILDIKSRPFNQIITQTNTIFSPSNSNIEIVSQMLDDKTKRTNIVSCQLQSYTNNENHRTINCEKLVENFHPELNLSCDFLLNITLRGRNKAGIHPVFYNIILFTTPDNEEKHVNQAVRSYAKLGLKLKPSTSTQWLSFLASLPFIISDEYYKELNMFGLIKKLNSNDVIQLLPFFSDKKGSRQGLLIPTHHQQIAFLNTFDDINYTIDNFNYLMTITNSKSKLTFAYMHIINELALDECIYVLDFDNSYQALCKIVGGNSIVVTNSLFNPFELLKIQNPQDRYILRDLLAVMVNPQSEIDDTQLMYLLNALEKSFQTKQVLSCMESFLDVLHEELIYEKNSCKNTLSEMITRLSNISESALFNNNITLSNKVNFTIFDLSQLYNKTDLLIPIILIIIVGILKHIQKSDPIIKKRLIIDNAQLHLTSGNNQIVANFIKSQFQLAAQYNAGFGVIVNSFDDILKTKQGHALMAASDMKIIVNKSNIKSYAFAFPYRLNRVQEGIISAFEDTKNSRYYDILIEAGRSLSLHRYWL